MLSKISAVLAIIVMASGFFSAFSTAAFAEETALSGPSNWLDQFDRPLADRFRLSVVTTATETEMFTPLPAPKLDKYGVITYGTTERRESSSLTRRWELQTMALGPKSIISLAGESQEDQAMSARVDWEQFTFRSNTGFLSGQLAGGMEPDGGSSWSAGIAGGWVAPTGASVEVQVGFDRTPAVRSTTPRLDCVLRGRLEPGDEFTLAISGNLLSGRRESAGGPMSINEKSVTIGWRHQFDAKTEVAVTLSVADSERTYRSESWQHDVGLSAGVALTYNF